MAVKLHRRVSHLLRSLGPPARTPSRHHLRAPLPRIGSVGGASKVYRGQLINGKVVSVKKLRPLGSAAQTKTTSSCPRLLVFECMPNCNLRGCLDLKSQGRKPMEWATRVAVAPRILRRDIKSINILLNYKFRDKITNLGMAKCLMNYGLTSCSSSLTRMLGMFGYFAPKYAIAGKASLKSDVFSFGLVVLELITGRQPVLHRKGAAGGGAGGDKCLVMWVTSQLRDKRLLVAELPAGSAYSGTKLGRPARGIPVW